MIGRRDTEPRIHQREPQVICEVLLELHVPMSGPLHTDRGRSFCRGCGGLTTWPCLTRRLVLGEQVNVRAELETTPPIGEPYRFEAVTA